MVELTLVGWKDPVVLDLPTTDRELEAAVHHLTATPRSRRVLHSYFVLVFRGVGFSCV